MARAAARGSSAVQETKTQRSETNKLLGTIRFRHAMYSCFILTSDFLTTYFEDVC